MSDPQSPLHKIKHSKGTEPVDKIYEIVHVFASEYMKSITNNVGHILDEALRPFQLEFLYACLIYFKKQLLSKDMQLMMETFITIFIKVIKLQSVNHLVCSSIVL
jgi:hypothetical protein